MESGQHHNSALDDDPSVTRMIERIIGTLAIPFTSLETESKALANVVALIRGYFCLDFDTCGKDVFQGPYDWDHKDKSGGPQ